MNKNNHRSFLFLLASAAIILIAAPLFQQGLFIDGLLYKTVSYNYYWGEAGFWQMKFTATSMNPFYEQPPFFFFFTGIWYKLASIYFLSDKFLTLLLLLTSLVLVRQISRLLFTEKIWPIAFLFLLSIPVLQWTYINQVIETMVMPLVLLCFWLFLKFRQTSNGIKWAYCVLFSLTVVLLFLTKGFQSCFIIIAPFLFFLFKKEKQSLLFALSAYIFIALSLICLLFWYQPSVHWFQNYMEKRLLASLNAVGATTTYRAEIIVRTFTELLIPLILSFAAWFWFRIKRKNPGENNNKSLGWILLLVGVSGSFPFAITLEQRGFYLVPSFPFYVLAFICFFKMQLFFFYQEIIFFFQRKWMFYMMMVLLASSFGYWIYSPALFKRDENLLHDLALIQPHLQKGDTISVDEDSWNDTALQAYLYTQNKVSVAGDYSHDFYIHDREHATVPDSAFQKIEIGARQYDLFRKKRP